MTTPILLAYDGSEGAERALVFAAALARAQGLALHLAAVVEPHFLGMQNPIELAHTQLDFANEIARLRDEVLLPRVDALKASGVAASFQVESGAVAATLVRIAEETGASHIVVGRRGASKLSRMLLGSVSQALVQSAPVPVTVVP